MTQWTHAQTDGSVNIDTETYSKAKACCLTGLPSPDPTPDPDPYFPQDEADGDVGIGAF